MLTNNQHDIDAAWRHLDQLTKPPRSLGRVEETAARLCGIQKTKQPQTKPRSVIIFAGDHGVCEEGVSAFPQPVTIEMMKNMANGGAAVSVLSKLHQAKLRIIDVGSMLPENEEMPGVERKLVRNGTRNFTNQPAMTLDECRQGIAVGRQTVSEEVEEGTKLILLGEMGIGNTTSAAAISAAVLNIPVENITGCGTGLNHEGWNHKKCIIENALHSHQITGVETVLSCLGGFEIAAMVGAMLEASKHTIPIVLDGFIVSAAALIACEMEPSVQQNLIAAHISAERGHRLVLDHLDLDPLLDLNLRLGEASGALIALPILDAAAAVFNEMATFKSANVSR